MYVYTNRYERSILVLYADSVIQCTAYDSCLYVDRRTNVRTDHQGPEPIGAAAKTEERRQKEEMERHEWRRAARQRKEMERHRKRREA